MEISYLCLQRDLENLIAEPEPCADQPATVKGRTCSKPEARILQ